MSRSGWVGLAGCIALLAGGLIACGESTETVQGSRCAGVSCGTDQECDEVDGICKCGGSGGVVCGEGQECTLDPSPRCFSSMCQFTSCERGESCDRLTGDCSCGGERCEEGEFCGDEGCRPAASCDEVVCAEGMSCDPADGSCKCAGERCEAGERCVEGACVFDRCLGVNCAANSSCSAEDGACHCGGSDGPICQLGQACLMVAESFDCVESDRCADVVCLGGTVCDPTDGECHCGGVGATAPICSPEQTCIEGECRGGGLCPPAGQPSSCTKGTSCDPADGQCKCGGAGGPSCAEDEACTSVGGSRVCSKSCSILGLVTGCAEGQGCYFDSTQQQAGTFCAAAGAVTLDQPCSSATECQSGLFCNRSVGKCRRVCRPSEGGVGCAGTGGPAAACAQIPNGPLDVGYCISDG